MSNSIQVYFILFLIIVAISILICKIMDDFDPWLKEIKYNLNHLEEYLNWRFSRVSFKEYMDNKAYRSNSRVQLLNLLLDYYYDNKQIKADILDCLIYTDYSDRKFKEKFNEKLDLALIAIEKNKTIDLT